MGEWGHFTISVQFHPVVITKHRRFSDGMAFRADARNRRPMRANLPNPIHMRKAAPFVALKSKPFVSCYFCGEAGHVIQQCAERAEYARLLYEDHQRHLHVKVPFDRTDDGTWELPQLGDADMDMDQTEQDAMRRAIEASQMAFEASADTAAKWERRMQDAYVQGQLAKMMEYRATLSTRDAPPVRHFTIANTGVSSNAHANTAVFGSPMRCGRASTCLSNSPQCKVSPTLPVFCEGEKENLPLNANCFRATTVV